MLSVTKNTYNGVDATSHNVPYPSDVLNGDLLVLFFGTDGNPTATLPVGWDIKYNANPSNKGFFATRKVTSTLTGTFEIGLSGSEALVASIYRVRTDTGKPLQVLFSGDTGGSGSTHIAPSLSYPWNPRDTVAFCGLIGFSSGTPTVSAYPTGYTDTQYVTSGTGTAHTALGVAYKIAELNSDSPSEWSLSGAVSVTEITVFVIESEIISVDPNFAIIDIPGNTTLEIVGDLQSGATVEIDGENCPITSQDDYLINVLYPIKEVAGVFDILIENPDGSTFFLEDGFRYTLPAPIIESVTPPGSIVGISTPITITGQNFRSGATVEINGEACTDIVVVNSETITCETPVINDQQLAVLVVENTDETSDSIDFSVMELIPHEELESERKKAGVTIESVDYLT